MLMVMMHGEDDADEDDDDTDDDDDDDDDAFVAYLIWTLVLKLGDLHSGTLFFDPRFRGDPVHLLLHLRVTSVFFFLLFLRISPINNNNHHHNVYLVPRILKTTFNTTPTIKAHWGSAASGVSLLNTLTPSKWAQSNPEQENFARCFNEFLMAFRQERTEGGRISGFSLG